MTALADWAAGALLGSTCLMLLVVAARGPVRNWIGPRFGYVLWLLPAIRLIVPPLPADLSALLPAPTHAGAIVLFVGAHGPWPTAAAAQWPIANLLVAVWLIGTATLAIVQVGRYRAFRSTLLAGSTGIARRGTIRIVAAAVDGPLAFGVVRRTVAVPFDFAQRYDRREQKLALAHEIAHHDRGDLIANWLSLGVLAIHWWNPIAWASIRAFREDQEYAVDAYVLARCDAGERPAYAEVLAKATGLATLPVCNLNPRSNLKGRLMMFTRKPLPTRRLILGGGGLALVATAALAATVSVGSTAQPASGRQAVTVGVKPDGAGSYALIVGGESAAPGTPLPRGATLPADFDPAGGCDIAASAKPMAMVIKGSGGITTYTVMCASAAPAPVPATLSEGLASLKTMRGSIATQPASAKFPETERRHALGAVDRSIREVEATLATTR